MAMLDASGDSQPCTADLMPCLKIDTNTKKDSRPPEIKQAGEYRPALLQLAFV